MLDYYNLELHHLNPNGIQQISTFVAFCEGYLGIEPQFDLWKRLFTVDFLKNQPMGLAGIKVRPRRAGEFISVPTRSANHGWHTSWFYLRISATAPLPRYTGVTPMERFHTFSHGIKDEDLGVLANVPAMIQTLKARGVWSRDVIGGYFSRGVVPLRERTRMLFQMTADAPREGTVTALELPSPDAVS